MRPCVVRLKSGSAWAGVICCCLIPRWMPAYPFATVRTVVVGEHPHGITAGDFNGDGRTDLASANTTSETVSVLLGNGDGTFQPKVDYPVQVRPKFVQAGDFNADGRVDLIAANEGSNSVTVLLGNGNGTFQAGIHSPAGCAAPHEVDIGDIDGDGRLDAVIPCWSGDTIGILFGTGTGGFSPPIARTTAAGPHSAVVADFNKDGRGDIAVANGWSNTMSLLLGTGNRTFASPVNYTTGSVPHFIRTADLNKDGNLDLFVANEGSASVSVFLGSANGTFAPGTMFAAAGLTESVASGDINGDGNLDLLTANSGSGNVSVLLGTGTGSFAAPVHFGAGDRPFHAIVAQLDSDGELDIAVANYGASDVTVLLTGSAPLPPGTTYLSTRSWTSMINGWGPAERDRSNGESAAGDGQTIRLNGVSFTRGLGVHAASDIRYAIQGCSAFRAQVGVDDEVGSAGSVVFQVFADGVKLFDSGVMTGASSTQTAMVNLSGRSELRLVVTDGGNNPDYDHADWADAQVTCAADTSPPTVSAVSPPANGADVSPSAAVTATFSEPIDSSTITASTFMLTAAGAATPLPAVVAYDAGSGIASLTPSAPLARGTLHTALLKGGSSGVKDVAGNALASDFSWSFTTSAQSGTYLSDRTWTSVLNGWGPPELDRSNGENAGGDGRPLTLNGVVYAKGLGVHASSDIRYNVAGCSTFTAQVGVDDEVGSAGSVIFQVLGDGVQLFDSGLMTGASATRTVSVSIAGRNELQLVVTPAGNGPDFDHADWANAQITCAADTTAPLVSAVTPSQNASGVATSTAVTARFSEPMDPSTLTTATVIVTPQGSAMPVPGAVTYNSSSASVSFVPASPLATGTVYNASIKGGPSGVKDAAGNPLTSDFLWSFTTSTTAPVSLTSRQWTSATNGWGPAEVNQSNGEAGAGDGRALTLNGAVFPTGLGVHANSDIRYGVAGCSMFTAQVGVDDEVGSRGSVVFQVYTDGVKVFDSGVMTGTSATQSVTVSLTGRSQLQLVVTNAGDGPDYDHADWAAPQLTCN